MPGSLKPCPRKEDQQIGGWPRHGLAVVVKRKLCLPLGIDLLAQPLA
jgi:hypothetical protein